MATLTMIEQSQPEKPEFGRTDTSAKKAAPEVPTTESPNVLSQGLDVKSALEIARIINQEDAKIAAAVKKALPEIAIVIDTVASTLR